jgi:NAD(P)-dependent dehydrogenase (short-subunit alcohol dehydrogenase family)
MASLDILVNNAMAYTWGGIDAMTTADWHANFSTRWTAPSGARALR